MATRLVQITMKARDEAALGEFWAQALGWGVTVEEPGAVVNVEPAGVVYPDPAAIGIDIVISTEPKTAKNRVHVDLATNSAAHKAELIARLEGLGATRIDIGQGDVSWTVMADPEGNEFCVLDWHDEEHDTGPIASVVVDSADPQAMARFWGEAMDWTVLKVSDDSAVLRSARQVGPYLQLLRNSDPKTGWNRVHLDVRPYPSDGLEAEAARLRDLGATPIAIEPEVAWKVFADPEGNEFCLLTPR